MLAASPTVASSPTSASTLIWGLTVRFMRLSPAIRSADRARAGSEERADRRAAAGAVLDRDPAACDRRQAEVGGGGCEARRVDDVRRADRGRDGRVVLRRERREIDVAVTR